MCCLVLLNILIAIQHTFEIHIYIDKESNTSVLFLEVIVQFIVLRHFFDNWVMYHVTCRHTTLNSDKYAEDILS